MTVSLSCASRTCWAAGTSRSCSYDVTTLYFEAEHEDGLRKVGYSKERRVDPQVVVGLLVDRHGLPARDRLLRGEQGREAHDPAGHPAVPRPARDREHGRGRRRRACSRPPTWTTWTTRGLRVHRRLAGHQGPVDLESHFRWHGDAFSDGQVIDTLTPKTGSNRDNDPALLAEPAWDRKDAPEVLAGGLGVLRAGGSRGTTRTLTAQENRARDVISGAQVRPHAPVRQERRTGPRPGREGPRPREEAGRAEGLRHQPPRHRDARRPR